MLLPTTQRDVMHVTAITNTSGSVLERYDYDAFSNTRVNGTSSNVSSYGWEIRFCSYLFDQESGFYQVRNRYLHPFLGRWLSRDPIGENGGINLYAYVRNNPARWKDPFGLKGACTITIYVGEYKRTNKGIGKTKTKNPPDPTNPCGYVGCGANHLNAAQIKRGDGVPDMATNNEEDTDADNDPDLGGSNDFTNSSQVPGQVKSSIEAASKLGNSLCKTCTCSSVKIVVSCDDVAALYVDECESTYNINCK